MPALPAVSHVVRVDFHQTLGGNTNVQNRCFFQYTGALSQADAQTWVDAIATAWKNNVVAAQNVGLSLNTTLLTDLTSDSAAQAISIVTGSGSGGGPSLGAGMAAVLKQKIARRYRGGHPRHYISGMQASQIATPETLTAAYITSLGGAWGAFISAALLAVPVAASPAFEVNVSYFSGFHNVTFPSGRQHAVPTARVTPVVDTVISHSVNPKIASQRRRNLQS